jgi:hypothetical protein
VHCTRDAASLLGLAAHSCDELLQLRRSSRTFFRAS